MRLSFLPVSPVYVFRRPLKCGYPILVKFFCRKRPEYRSGTRSGRREKALVIHPGRGTSVPLLCVRARPLRTCLRRRGGPFARTANRTASRLFFPVSLRMTTMGLIMHLYARQRIRPARGDRLSPDRNARRADSCRVRRVRWRPIPAAESFCSSANTADR